MKIVNPKYFDVIEINDAPETLVIENATFFRRIISELYEQCQTDIGDFVLSENNIPLSLSKSCQLVTDIYDFDKSARQAKTKIQQLLIKESISMDEQYDLLAKLNSFALKLANTLEYQISFKDNVSIADIIKLLDFNVDYKCLTFWERLEEYMSLCVDLLGYKLIITVNLKTSISKEEYKAFIHDIQCRSIPLLMIERSHYEELDNLNHLRIIDSQLCVL